MDVLQSSASASSVFRFTEVTEEEALAGLKSGKFDGAMVFPPNFISSVFGNGESGPAKFYEPPTMNSLDQGLMEGLIEVGRREIRLLRELPRDDRRPEGKE